MTYSTRRIVGLGGSPRIFMVAGSTKVGPIMAMAANTWTNSRNLYMRPPAESVGASGLAQPGAADGLGRFGQQTDDERAEVGVHRRDLVEAHLVEDLLEGDRIVGQQRDTPLPVVEGEGAGDQLQHPAGVGHADPGVTAHELAPLLEGELVPVDLAPPALGHRVEADQLL